MKRKFLAEFCCLLMVFGAYSCAATPKKQPKEDQAKAIQAVGEAYMRDGNFTMALKELLKAQEMNPDDPDIQNDLGLTYMAKKKNDLAIKHFKKAVEQDSDFTAARNNLGAVYLAAGQWDSAITQFEAVVKDLLYTTPHFPLTNLGWAYFSKRNFETSERYYKEALEVQPRYVIALRGLARVYLMTNRPSEAQRTLDKALGIAPRFAPLYFELAKTYLALNDRKSAIETYKKIIALFPGTEHEEEAKREAGELMLNIGG